jgi:hypothetical protein
LNSAISVCPPITSVGMMSEAMAATGFPFSSPFISSCGRAGASSSTYARVGSFGS